MNFSDYQLIVIFVVLHREVTVRKIAPFVPSLIFTDVGALCFFRTISHICKIVAIAKSTSNKVTVPKLLSDKVTKTHFISIFLVI